MALKVISNEKFREITESVHSYATKGDYQKIFPVLKPTLDAKCSFTKLDRMGKMLGDSAQAHPSDLYPLLEEIISYNAMGGYVVVAQALVSLLAVDFDQAMKLSQNYISRGATWYVCDILGERVIGQALHRHFDQTLPWLKRCLSNKDNWVRRSGGVAVHLFVKRNKTGERRIKSILQILEPHIEEKQIDVVKGIGWGLKTIGRHHPDLMDNFLRLQFRQKKRLSGLMVSKATTYFGKPRRAALERYVRALPA